MTTVTGCYLAGRKSYQDGEGLDDCPHPHLSAERRQWRSGWRDEHRFGDEDDAGLIQDDTPSLANCDDAGTGEGRYHHGRM